MQFIESTFFCFLMFLWTANVFFQMKYPNLKYWSFFRQDECTWKIICVCNSVLGVYRSWLFHSRRFAHISGGILKCHKMMSYHLTSHHHDMIIFVIYKLENVNVSEVLKYNIMEISLVWRVMSSRLINGCVAETHAKNTFVAWFQLVWEWMTKENKIVKPKSWAFKNAWKATFLIFSWFSKRCSFDNFHFCQTHKTKL